MVRAVGYRTLVAAGFLRHTSNGGRGVLRDAACAGENYRNPEGRPNGKRA